SPRGRPAAPRAPPSLPTRRSSDLSRRPAGRAPDRAGPAVRGPEPGYRGVERGPAGHLRAERDDLGHPKGGRLTHLTEIVPFGSRSEEHTSELQSLAYLVCRLLLEK